jgi:hypothetical protein
MMIKIIPMTHDHNQMHLNGRYRNHMRRMMNQGNLVKHEEVIIIVKILSIIR